VRFLVDAQLPPRLARWLREQNHEATHVADVGLRHANDSAIWRHAVATSCALISKDQDFAQRRALAAEGPQVVWLRVGNISSADLVALFSEVFADILQALESGETVIEVRQL
jgi:predicted nuclease of predicted toxin-antitoxin system